MTRSDTALPQLDALVGEWEMNSPDFPGPSGRTTYEWLQGGRFLIQRWEVPVPEAPDGIAVIGADGENGEILQHYFDSRGVSRVYQLSLTDGVLRIWRDEPGFYQRFTGTFSSDGDTINGLWEISEDGSQWRNDFRLDYTRAR
jgi:hypothetical protein